MGEWLVNFLGECPFVKADPIEKGFPQSKAQLVPALFGCPQWCLKTPGPEHMTPFLCISILLAGQALKCCTKTLFGLISFGLSRFSLWMLWALPLGTLAGGWSDAPL